MAHTPSEGASKDEVGQSISDLTGPISHQKPSESSEKSFPMAGTKLMDDLQTSKGSRTHLVDNEIMEP